MAAQLLAQGDAKVSAVALEVGYDSEAAFSRAFKKDVGQAPAVARVAGNLRQSRSVERSCSSSC
jgi:AraC-like DNA-binding protein